MKLLLIALNITLNFSDFGKYCILGENSIQNQTIKEKKTKTK